MKRSNIIKSLPDNTYFRIILSLIAIIGFAQTSFAQYETYNHPELKWEIIETEHFNIFFHSGENRTPKILAKIAEEIYEPVTTAYRFEPDSKIDILVKDYEDFSNGAAYYYENKIEIWAPSLDFLLRGTSNWLRNVFTHEFTHLIQLQTSRKISRSIPAVYLQHLGYEDEKRDDVLYGFVNRVISTPIAGTVVPGWFAEGIAQYHTLKMGYDRWDTHRDMILRTRALEQGLYTLTEMGVFGKSSIGNESVYNHGFSFVEYLASTYGDEILEKISRAMSSLPVISIEKAIKKAAGEEAGRIYENWVSKVESHYFEQSNNIQRKLVRGEILDIKGTAILYPSWSPDGKKLAYLSNNNSDYLSFTGLFIQDIETGKTNFIKEGIVTPAAWFPDGKSIIYSRINKNKENSLFFDLFRYDLETEKENRLTENRRARYPSVSPDGKTVYFTSAVDGESSLSALDIGSGQIELLKKFVDGQEVYVSDVSPDGDKILFSMSSHFGRDIAVINPDGSGFDYLMKNTIDDRNPSFSPDGKKLYYSSDKTGIFNIYVYDLVTDQSDPLTNVLGGAFMPSVNEDNELVYSLFTHEGYKLAKISDPTPVDPVDMRYEPVVEYDIPDKKFNDSQIPDYQSESYTFQYRPSQFYPRLMIDYGKPKLGVYSFAGDVLGKYTLFMGAAMNAERDRDLFAIFEFRKFRPTIFLEMYNLTRHETFYFDDIYPPETDEVVLGYWEVDIGTRQKISDTQEINVSANVIRQSANVKPLIEGVHFRPLKYDYYKGLNFNLRWYYSKVVPTLDGEINPSFGRKIDINYWRNYDDIFEDFDIDAKYGTLAELYKKYSYNKITLDWKEYIGTNFFMDRSALSFNLQAGFIDKPVDDFLYFFSGGLIGLKGYTFYSIEGRKMLIGSAAYRFPLIKNIAKRIGPLTFDKLYASAGYQIGDAWNSKFPDISQMKRVLDLGLRLDVFSFYSFPTRVGFHAAYGIDKFEIANRMEGKDWKFYLTVLFGYEL
ncbi:BamA/TamA family outer membrane protein [candidate division KSB1 bacterium]